MMCQNQDVILSDIGNLKPESYSLTSNESLMNYLSKLSAVLCCSSTILLKSGSCSYATAGIKSKKKHAL